MAGKEISHVAGDITAVGDGYVTLVSVAGFYENAIVWLNDSTVSDDLNKRCIITEVDAVGNRLGLLIRPITAGSAPSYGRSDMTDYNGGSVTQHEQFVYNSNEEPLA